MKEAKNVVVRLEGRAFVFEVDIAEEDLIAEMISSLGLFIKRGFPIKVSKPPRRLWVDPRACGAEF